MVPGEWFGARHVEWHEEVDSTNTRAAALASDVELPLPALIVADAQTAGRGRGANRWWSSAGALTFSVLLDATESALPAARWPLVSLTTAVAVGDTLASLLPQSDVQLKWPNDVYIAGKKVCGILVEVPPLRPARLIVGVGLNVNNRLVDAPEEIHARATSLADEAGETFDREAVLGNLMQRLLALLPLVADGSLDLVRLWQPRCLLQGKHVWIDASDSTIAGRCLGIDASGALLVRTETGIERMFAGVVKRWE